MAFYDPPLMDLPIQRGDVIKASQSSFGGPVYNSSGRVTSRAVRSRNRSATLIRNNTFRSGVRQASGARSMSVFNSRSFGPGESVRTVFTGPQAFT